MLGQYTDLNYLDFGNMPHHELMEMIDTFKPRLKQLAESAQNRKLTEALGGG